MTSKSEEFGEVEAKVLGSQIGLALLAEVGLKKEIRPSDLKRWRKVAGAEFASAAIRIVESRRRGATKFSRASEMWFDSVGVEQATAEVVSRHKARRFEGKSGLVVDLCCGIGGDTVALASHHEVLAVDLDRAMCRRTVWNTGVHGVRKRIFPVQAHAEQVEIPPGTWVHVDPDRRPHRVERWRAKGIEDYRPGLTFLRGLAVRVPGGAIKVSPASDFQAAFVGLNVEVELVSLNGECKEATIWFGEAAGPPRRATALPSGETWTAPPDGSQSPAFATSALQNWIYDPDPALLRSGLLASFAFARGLSPVREDVAYLTSAEPLTSAFLQRFEVICETPLDLKVIRREAAARDLRLSDIKVRGLRLRPEDVRRSLRPSGSQPCTLLLFGGSGPARAVIGRRIRES